METRKLTDKELKKLQEIELEILIEFDNICRKNNLKYVLTAGTLLGAIRHKGFIPWDDDVDVAMPKEDYDKFREIQKKELNKNKFYYQSMETDDDITVLFAKIRRKDSVYSEALSSVNENKQGIWIDIFPIYNTSDNMFIAKWYMFKVICLKIIFSLNAKNTIYTPVLYKKMIIFFLKIVSVFYTREKCIKKLNKITSKFNDKKTINKASYAGDLLMKGIFKYDIFDELIEAEFEGHKFYIPKKYDIFLKDHYGNYMELPPIEKQCSNHFISEIKFPK